MAGMTKRQRWDLVFQLADIVDEPGDDVLQTLLHYMILGFGLTKDGEEFRTALVTALGPGTAVALKPEVIPEWWIRKHWPAANGVADESVVYEAWTTLMTFAKQLR